MSRASRAAPAAQRPQRVLEYTAWVPADAALRALSPSIGIRAARVTVDISPRFDGKGPAVAIAGMIEARAGQIILAAARSGMDYLSGRIAPWTDIRSKAS